MAKKKSRAHQVSKGQRKNVSNERTRGARSLNSGFDNLLNKLSAWQAGRPVNVTITNPDATATNRRFITVSARDLWGDPRANVYAEIK